MTKRITVETAEEILGLYFPVLDHGFISLVSYDGGDLAVEQSARVSYGAGTRKATDTRNLLRYLKRHAHSTPFEMVQLKFHICMPIVVSRQHVRHRMSSTNEYSGRYSVMPTLFYTPDREQVCAQSTSNKQGSAEPVTEDVYEEFTSNLRRARTEAGYAYNTALGDGVARETARIDLPLSTYTQFYWSIDLHNLFHYLTLRCDSHAQWEIRQYANAIAGVVQRVAPISYEAWLDYDLCGVRFSKQELESVSTKVHTGVWPSTELKGRELKEFETKLELYSTPAPDFSLDISTAKSADYYEQLFAEAVPKP